MSDEHTKRVEYEAIASEKEKQLQYVSQDLHQYKNLLAKEKTCTEKLRGDINMLQVLFLSHTSKVSSLLLIIRQRLLQLKHNWMLPGSHCESASLKQRVK